MRRAELVVRYVEGPALGSNSIEYGGVFLPEPEMDRTFARSEPPSHDDWSHQFLEDPHEKTFVRVALRRINEVLRQETTASPISGADETQTSIASFADSLASLLPAREGPGASVPGATIRKPPDKDKKTKTGKPASQRARPHVEVVSQELDVVDDVPVVVIDFTVSHARRSSSTIVEVSAGAVLDGGEVERDPPAGAREPAVLRWRRPDGKLLAGTQRITVRGSTSGTWSVVVTVPDVMVGVTLEGSAEHEA
jgi:hypothetical protein